MIFGSNMVWSTTQTFLGLLDSGALVRLAIVVQPQVKLGIKLKLDPCFMDTLGQQAKFL